MLYDREEILEARRVKFFVDYVKKSYPKLNALWVFFFFKKTKKFLPVFRRMCPYLPYGLDDMSKPLS